MSLKKLFVTSLMITLGLSSDAFAAMYCSEGGQAYDVTTDRYMGRVVYIYTPAGGCAGGPWYFDYMIDSDVPPGVVLVDGNETDGSDPIIKEAVSILSRDLKAITAGINKSDAAPLNVGTPRTITLNPSSVSTEYPKLFSYTKKNGSKLSYLGIGLVIGVISGLFLRRRRKRV